MEPSDAPPQEQGSKSRLSVGLAAGAVSVLVLALLGYALSVTPTLPPQLGSPVPDFQLTAMDGRPLNLSELQGKVIILNFFASWCNPCRQEATDLQQTWQHYQDREVQFLGVAYKDAASKAQTFLDEFDVTYPFTPDPGNRTARAYGVTGVPETFVIDQAGHLVHHFVGPVTQGELSLELDRLLEP